MVGIDSLDDHVWIDAPPDTIRSDACQTKREIEPLSRNACLSLRPLVWRPLMLEPGVTITLAISHLCVAASLFLLVFYTHDKGFYETRNSNVYFIARFLPSIIGTVTSLLYRSTIHTFCRIYPFVLMADPRRGRTGVSAWKSVAALWYPFFEGRYTPLIMLLRTCFFISAWIVAAKTALLSVVTLDVGWALVVHKTTAYYLVCGYVIMAACTIACTICLWHRETGLLWDPASLADQVALFSDTNVFEMLQSRGDGKKLPATQGYRLGYWRVGSPGCPKHRVAYGVGLVDADNRKNILQLTVAFLTTAAAPLTSRTGATVALARSEHSITSTHTLSASLPQTQSDEDNYDDFEFYMRNPPQLSNDQMNTESESTHMLARNASPIGVRPASLSSASFTQRRIVTAHRSEDITGPFTSVEGLRQDITYGRPSVTSLYTNEDAEQNQCRFMPWLGKIVLITWMVLILAAIAVCVNSITRGHLSNGFSIDNTWSGSRYNSTSMGHANQTLDNDDPYWAVDARFDPVHDLFLYALVMRQIPTAFASMFAVGYLEVVDFAYRFIQPFKNMRHIPASAKETLLLDYYTASPIETPLNALGDKHYKVALFSILASVSPIFPILVGGLFTMTNTGPEIEFVYSKAAFAGVFTYLIIYIVCLVIAWPTPDRLMPQRRFTLIDIAEMVCASQLAKKSCFHVSEKRVTRDHLKSRIFLEEDKYMFGTFKGMDKCWHLGVDVGATLINGETGNVEPLLRTTKRGKLTPALSSSQNIKQRRQRRQHGLHDEEESHELRFVRHTRPVYQHLSTGPSA